MQKRQVWGLYVTLGCWGLLGGTSLRAQDVVPLPRLTGSVSLDGRSDEPAWQAIAPLPMTVYEPVFGGTPRERTEIRVAYDDAFLYVAGRLYDADPTGIKAYSLHRDRSSGDDVLALVLDPFNDNETGFRFFTTPAGIRFDQSIFNDAEESAGFPFNNSWDAFWDVATVRDEAGWFAEMRIPFSSLGFQAQGDSVVMGLTVYRYLPRYNERHVFPAISPAWEELKPSQAQDVLLVGIQSRRLMYLSPYALGGLGQKTHLNRAGTAYQRDDDLTREAGVDLRYNLTSNLTLDLTLNTDFAQAEADEQVINLTRFSPFFPEKRAFFLERAGIFEFFTGRDDRLFHSRRIGLHEGRPVRILGGARIVGRAGRWDVGALDLQTAASPGLPSENFGVLRLRRQVFNAYSYAGGLVTSRAGTDGSYNVAYGLDGLFRLFGDDFVGLKWTQTFDHALFEADAFSFTQAALWRAQWERRRRQGWHYDAALTWSGADYRPAMGFITRRDYTEGAGRLAYGWFPEAGPLRKATPELSASVFVRNADGSVASAFFRHGWTLEPKVGGSRGLGVFVQVEDLRTPLSLPESVRVPEGRYTFYGVEAGVRTGPRRTYRLSANAGLGTFYDGWLLILETDPTWNVSRHLELGAAYRADLVRFPDRGVQFTTHLLRLRLLAALNTQVSARALIQYSSASDDLAINVRFRYNVREGHDFWLVYNEIVNTDRYAYDPVLPLTDTRTVLVKYSYTFRI